MKKKTIMKEVIICLIIIGVFAVAYKMLFEHTHTTRIYDAGVTMMNHKEYDNAISYFELTLSYKDSRDKIEECKYLKAKTLLSEKKYDQAMEEFEAMKDYEDSPTMITECIYNKALDYVANENYVEALETFQTIRDYKDSQDKMEECKKALLESARPGDYIFFGNYEQDNDTANGPEEIKWLVLDYDYDKILLISSEILECKPYHAKYEPITWENCSLRNWLNKDFMTEAFNESERKDILKTKVPAEESFDHWAEIHDQKRVDPGNDTKDHIFLLSNNEAEKYLRFAKDRMCGVTEYVFKKYHSGDNWILRGPGYSATCTPMIQSNDIDKGDISKDGYTIDMESGIRPAMWIKTR